MKVALDPYMLRQVPLTESCAGNLEKVRQYLAKYF